MKKARSLFSVSILAMVLWVSGLGLTPYATAHEITNIDLSPPSPAALLNNEYVDITFDYSTTEAGGVRITPVPYTDGSPTPHHAYCGPPVYYGSGAGSSCFRITSGDVIVDQIRFRMYNFDFSVVLLEFFIDVEYHYGNSITNIELTPPSPAVLPNNEYVDVTYDYSTTEANGVRIHVAPYTDGSLTPGCAVCGSPIYPAGKGDGSCFFTIMSGDKIVDQLRFRMYNADRSVLLLEFFIPVSYRFCEGTDTWYVDADAPGANTGVDWTNAFSYLQDALAVAVLGDEIKVAEGTYKPDEGGGQTPGDRAAAFQLISAVTIRGGYAGWGEPEPDLRDIEVYETILSGDIGTQGNNSDNSYHVVTGSGTDETAYLEGFTITGGYANGPVWPDDKCGGGMYNGESSSPTVINCKFTANTAQRWGAGMFNISSSPTVTNCTFTNNTALNASYGGGGMCNRTGGSPTVTNCTFSNNSGSTGGGMYNHTNCSPTVTNCIFTGNSAGDYDGGGMRNISSSPTVINCTFSNNATSDTGGGMHNSSSSPMVINCTFSGNTAATSGGGVYNYSSSPTVTNCILWGDIGGEIVDDGTSSTTITYSDVQGGWGDAGNIDADPCFVDAAGGDLRLSSSASPCVDAGDNNAPNLPATDLAGNPRVADGDGDDTAIVDMGAYELQSKVHNITKDLWYETIQPAIDDANDGDQIEVAPGTYYEAIDFNGRAVRLYSSGGPDVTTIDGTGAYHVIQCISGEGASTILEGFTITGGNANGPYDSDKRGGGMFNYYSSPTVTNCIFRGNSASSKGGGMSNYHSSPTVTNCNFGGNSAASKGGGMYNEQSNSTVTDCNFTDNWAAEGGGMHTDWMNPTVTNCTFSGNVATYGGGMNNNVSSPIVINCTFSGNTAGTSGGGMLNNNDVGIPTVTNCTFSKNSAGVDGGGMYNNNCSPTVTNCILWGNTPDEIFNNIVSATVTYSNVEGGWGGTGNINADPCFVDADANDLRLLYDSPCIDTGDNSAPNLPATDLAGNGRLFDGDGNGSTIVDMGAYEFGSIKLVAHWRLDEGSGEVAYDSISDNDGTLEPVPPVWQPSGGRIGGALEFDGLNDFVSIPNESNFDVTNEITVSAWIKVTAFDRGWQAIVTKGDYAWRIQRDAANNALEFAVSGTSAGNILGSVNVNDGQWHHAAGVYDGTMIYLYVDGVVDNSVPASGTISTNDFPVMIGENAERQGRLWNGLLDDVAIFSRALNGTEITNLKNNGGASFIADPDLKALWELDESSGTTASDSAGGNHGMLEPAFAPPLWQPDGGRLGGALEFDGVDDFVSIPNESRFDITYQLTVSAWIQVAAFDKDWQAIVTKGDAAWRLHRLQDTNSIAFHCNNYPYWGADGNIGVDDGQWHHVAGVYDGTRAYLYVDGVLDNSEPAFGLISKNDFPVMIGENAERPGRCWNGLIDDVRIYTCALNPSEVYLLYSNVYYVDADANGNNDGSSWTDAFNYLQDALAQATSGLEIQVAEGTYKPDATGNNPSGTGDRTATFELINGVILKGGYAGFGQPDPNVKDCDLYETILSGDINTPGDANDNCYHVVTSSGCDLYTVLDGFTITGGNAIGDGSGYPYNHTYLGGGMYNLNSSPTVKDCNFSTNSVAGDGGGMYNMNNSNPMVTNCAFSSNSATNWSGGGMYNMNNSNPTVTNCTFSSNSANYVGGGMCNNASSPTVTNCTFSGNSAANWGGGMCNWESSSPTFTNCTLSGNIATNSGGGIMNNLNSKPTFINCILWGNSPDQVEDYDYPSSFATVNYSDVQGGWGGAGGNNIDADPCFVDAAAGNLRLRPGSLCVDKGSNAAVPSGITTDLDGRPRIIDGDCDDIDVVDMGAYELCRVHNVTRNLYYGTIQGAIDDANDGDQIEVASGIYNEAIIFKGKAVRLYSTGGPEVTTIDANGLSSSVVRCINGEDANTVLEGFTITGGNATKGGGMYNNDSSPKVSNCIFINNSASDGGGMYNNVGSPTVTDCTFNDNTAGNHAGGMYNNNSNSAVNDCIFTGNTSGAGGGMFNGGGSPAVTNCIFSGNSAGYGAGMWNYGSAPTVTNCTFSTNTGSVGGGMYNEAGSNSTVTNCIFWGDTLNEIINSASSPTITYSDVQGGYTGTGNIDADPRFTDAAGGDLRLRPGSPCIDKGSNAAVPSGITTDLDGRPRIIDGDCDDIDVVDMGAYEFAMAYFGDFDNNCSVNFFDVSIFGRAWMTQQGDADYDPACNISDPPDDYIDWRDAAILCENWLAAP